MVMKSLKRRLMLFSLVAAWMAVGDLPTVEAARDSHVCSEICNGGTQCGQECWLTQFEFDQDYPPTSCGDQGYDCCGDGWCVPGPEGCNVCGEDCGDVPQCDVECWYNGDCDTNEVCSSQHVCVVRPQGGDFPPDSGCAESCTSNGQCCGSEVCIGDPGQKYCGIPSPTYCPNSPACYDAGDCDEWADQLCSSQNHAIMFCDPGIGRCQFLFNPACPGSGNVCY